MDRGLLWLNTTETRTLNRFMVLFSDSGLLPNDY